MQRGKGAKPRQANGAPEQNRFRSADPLVDVVLGGRYKVSKLLGKGGIGSVYLADDTGSKRNRQVAIKLLQEQYCRDEAMYARIQREAKAGLVIQHPNVVRCTDVGVTDDGRVFLVMEYVQGEELTRKIERKEREKQRFSWDETRAVALQLCDALKPLHEHVNERGEPDPIIHRDIKPDNIIIRDMDQRLKLLDFGLAKFSEETHQVTQTGMVLGTPTYMAPEQIWGNGNYGTGVDIYAVGTIMYQMLAGRAPFVGEKEALYMMKHPEKGLSPQKMNAVVPGLNLATDIEEIVMRAIDNDPRRRYPDIDVFKRAILQRDAFPTARSTESIADDLMGQLMRSMAAEQNLEVPRSMQDDSDYVPDPPRRSGAFGRFLRRAFLVGLIGAGIAGYIHRDWVNEVVPEYFYRARDYVSDKVETPTPQKSTTYRIETRPRGASIHQITGHGEKLLGNTDSGDLRVSLEGNRHTLIIRKAGYRDRRIDISPEKTQISVGLRRIMSARKRKTIRLDSAQTVTSQPSEDEAIDGTE